MGRILWEMHRSNHHRPHHAGGRVRDRALPDGDGGHRGRHKITWDPDEPIMSDPDMADAIFQAGVELLLEVGLYCKDTQTNRQVHAKTRSRRSSIPRSTKSRLGKDRDAITLKPRAPGDPQHPYTFFPAGAITKDVNLYKQYAMTAAQEPTCDGLIPIPLFG